MSDTRFEELIQELPLLPPQLALELLKQAHANGDDFNSTAQVDEEDTPLAGGPIALTALAQAVHPAVAEYLLKQGADPNRPLEDGLLAADLAYLRGNYQVLVRMLVHGLAWQRADLVSERYDYLSGAKQKQVDRIADAFFGDGKRRAEVEAWSLDANAKAFSRAK